MASLDKVISDLDKQEKAIHSKMRPPLEQNRPVQDSADRLQDLRVISAVSHSLAQAARPRRFNFTPCVCRRQDIAATVSRIEPEKKSKVQEAKSFLVSNPTCASAPQLNSKVDTANKKYDKVEQLLQLSQEK